MDEYRRKYWKIMIKEIENYLHGDSDDFYSLVGALEGSLDASEIDDPELIKKWYDFWTPLEIRRATEGQNINRKEVIIDLIKMRNFLLSQNIEG